MKIQLLPSAVVLFCIAIFVSVSSARAQSVSISASPTTITDAGDESTITLTVSPPSSRDIFVKLMLSGTAAQGSDYILYGSNFTKDGRVWIPAGQTSVSIFLHAFYDGDPPNTSEVAKITILRNRRYQVGSPSSASVTIDNVE